MRRDSAGGLAWVLPLLLLVPPAANIARDLYRSRTRPTASPADGGAGRADPSRAPGAADSFADPAAAEIAALHQILRDKDHELRVLGAWGGLAGRRYAPLGAGVVRAHDPSHRRSAIWVWAASLEGVTPRTAVIHTGPQALVGRVERIFGDRLARVQTVRDRLFRIRFRYIPAPAGGGSGSSPPVVWGFLAGTGRSDAAGRPLLEIRHLGAEVPFREGGRIETDGDDGVYPGGIPIGELVRGGGGSDGDLFEVRSYLTLDEITEVDLLVDRAAREARAAEKEAASE